MRKHLKPQDSLGHHHFKRGAPDPQVPGQAGSASRAAEYLRVSTNPQEEHGSSLETQRAAIDRVVRALKQIPPRVFESPEQEAAVLAAISADEEQRQQKQVLDYLGHALPRLRLRSARSPSSIATAELVQNFLKLKAHQNLEDSTLLTYGKRLAQFLREFPVLPQELDPLLEYLSRFDGKTGRHKFNQQTLLNMLYEHAVRYFALPKNPLEGVPRPQVHKQPIHTLTLEEVALVDRTPETTTERVAWEILVGHGWRGVELRRILGGDVRRSRDDVMWCWGKERDEDAPILSETLSLLNELTPKSLPDDQPVLRSRRIRNGSTQPLGEDGISQLIDRLFARAGTERFTGHDLRRTCSTLVREASGDEILAMRLIRDKVPGYDDRYINFPLPGLVAALNRYSPLHLIEGCRWSGSSTLPRLHQQIPRLLIQLLNQLDQIGQTARQLKESLTGNDDLAHFETLTGQFSRKSPCASEMDGKGDSLFNEAGVGGTS